MRGLSAAEIETFLKESFPGVVVPTVRHADGARAELTLPFQPTQLRPGGTISGPTLMALADTAVYALVLSAVGHVPLAVTTDLTIHFLRKPEPVALLAEATMLKLGRSLAVGTVSIRSEGHQQPCAHAVVTYALPVASK